MSTIDETGFTRDRFNEQREMLVTKWKSYFPKATTDPESNNGRIISLQSELNDMADAKIEYLLASFDPRSAIGNQLSNLAPLMNKRRRAAVRSSVTLTLTANASGATVPAGAVVSQSGGPARFITTVEAVISPGASVAVPAEASVFGPVLAEAGSIDTIITPYFGWVSVTNGMDASAGRERDTDGVLRANMLATSAAAVGTPEGIYTGLIQVPGVTYAKVYENRDDTINALSMPPHSIFAVVDGGADSDIGAALLATVAYGIDYTDETDIPDASWVSVVVQNPANLQPETVWFSRPVPLPIVVVVEGAADFDFPSDGQDIMKKAILDLVASWDIGRTLYSSKLYVPANSVPGVDINSITIDGIDRVVPETFEKITLADADITINII